MKRRALCVFSLLFWLLTVSTFVSARVERLMTPMVEIQEINAPLPGTTISADALFCDETGMHLYTTFEGFGWETGQRVYEVPAGGYTLMGERVEIKNAGGYILYAANTPEPGALVQIREEPYLFMDDALVAVYPGGVPAYSIAADGMFVETQTDTALLLAAPGADYPFMENRARLYLQAPKDPDYYTLGPDSSFYSLNDLYWFMSNLLLAALLLAVLFFSVAIWARCCKLSRDMKKNRRLLLVNGALAAAALAGIQLILYVVDLPSSLLPRSRITDFAHYAETFSALFSALRDLAQNGSAAAADAIRFAQGRMVLAGLIVLAGILISVGKIVFGSWLDKRRSRPKPRHAAW